MKRLSSEGAVVVDATGTDVAIEAADVEFRRDDWSMVPEAIRISRRTSCTIRQNFGFTTLNNKVGIALAALSLLTPVWAAAQSSSRKWQLC